MKEIIKIPNPCSQRFDNFSKTEKGGFCRSCQKEVIDFRTMSPNEISNYFLNNPGKSCGIFKSNQLTPSEIFHRKAKFSSFLTLGLVGFLGISFPGLAQTPPSSSMEQAPADNTVISKNDTISLPKRTIKGKVISYYWKEKQSLSGATVQIKGLPIGTTADIEGNFELDVPDSVKSQKIILLVSFVGFKIKEVSIYDTQLPVQLGEILLSEDEDTILGEYIVILSKKTFWQKITGVFKSDPNPKCENTSHKH